MSVIDVLLIVRHASRKIQYRSVCTISRCAPTLVPLLETIHEHVACNENLFITKDIATTLIGAAQMRCGSEITSISWMTVAMACLRALQISISSREHGRFLFVMDCKSIV